VVCPGVSRARDVLVMQPPPITLVQLPEELGVSSKNLTNSLCISEGSDLHSGLPLITSSDIESDSCSSVSSGGPVGKVLNMEDFQARQCLDIVHDAVCLLSKSRKKLLSR
jgi:hypothetical protein